MTWIGLNTGQKRRKQLEYAEYALEIAAKKVVEAGDEKSRGAAVRRMEREAAAVLRTRLGYLKARRAMLNESPTKRDIEKQARDFRKVDAEEKKLRELGVAGIAEEALRHAGGKEKRASKD